MAKSDGDIYGFEVRDIDGSRVSLRKFEGKLLLVVNVASRCGFTPQYRGLEDLYQRFRERGLVVLGFPCNQFGRQEPGDESEIRGFCDLNYKITFPMFAKIEVNGSGADPLYKALKAARPGIFGTQKIKWNFTKFLVDRKGHPVARFAPNRAPESLVPEIEARL